VDFQAHEDDGSLDFFAREDIGSLDFPEDVVASSVDFHSYVDKLRVDAAAASPIEATPIATASL
jgi:hypothetical protein